MYALSNQSRLIWRLLAVWKVFMNNEMVTKGTRGVMMHSVNNLTEASINEQYTIKDIVTDDLAMKDFLFTLGCYKGETITVISELADNYVVALKDARYSIDKELAEAVIILH